MIFGRDDSTSTVIQCERCGEKHDSPKPGISGRSLLNCPNCGEKTFHTVSDND